MTDLNKEGECFRIYFKALSLCFGLCSEADQVLGH